MSIILNGKTIAGAPPPSDTANAAKKADLTSIIATGATNATGATIASGTYFYLNGSLVLAKADIASGASFTENTNYEAVTAGGLNSLKSAFNYTPLTLSSTNSRIDSITGYVENGVAVIKVVIKAGAAGWISQVDIGLESKYQPRVEMAATSLPSSSSDMFFSSGALSTGGICTFYLSNTNQNLTTYIFVYPIKTT